MSDHATLLLTIPEAADYLGRTRSFVEARIRDGSLPAVRAGRRRYLNREDIDTWRRRAARAQREPEIVVVAPEVWR